MSQARGHPKPLAGMGQTGPLLAAPGRGATPRERAVHEAGAGCEGWRAKARSLGEEVFRRRADCYSLAPIPPVTEERSQASPISVEWNCWLRQDSRPSRPFGSQL